MIVALNPNTGVDYTLRVPNVALGVTIRAFETAWGMGGKAIDAAWNLGKLGQPVRALGFAAGLNGQRMEEMLQSRGVQTDFVWVKGETRLNIILVDSGSGSQSTFTSAGLMVEPGHQAALLDKLAQSLQEAACLIIGGSLPEGVSGEFYRLAITQAHERNIPVIFDSSGPALRAGLQARPNLIKPNLVELGEIMGSKLQTEAEITAAARQIQASYGADVIVTLGSGGALSFFGEHAFQIPPLPVPVRSTAGAGDGVLAGMAIALSNGEPLESGLRYGFALAGAIVQTLPTADFDLETYRGLLDQVQIRPVRDEDIAGLTV